MNNQPQTKKELIRQLVTSIYEKETLNGEPVDIDFWIKRVEETTHYCIGCELECEGVAIFMPENSIEFGGVAGKHRHVFYGACQDCMETDGFQAWVEHELKEQVAREMGQASPVRH